MSFPCLAVVGAARKEMGGPYAAIMVSCATLLAWSVTTLFYQLVEAHNIFYISFSIILLLCVYGWLYLLGKKEEVKGTTPLPPPIVRM